VSMYLFSPANPFDLLFPPRFFSTTQVPPSKVLRSNFSSCSHVAILFSFFFAIFSITVVLRFACPPFFESGYGGRSSWLSLTFALPCEEDGGVHGFSSVTCFFALSYKKTFFAARPQVGPFPPPIQGPSIWQSRPFSLSFKPAPLLPWRTLVSLPGFLFPCLC